ncbi:hypothetical protein VTN31DRAFT_1159 [Thermomyces dupontii]|uniref:uncharacterized protein n=1 Tax=Talaromyces thermophilus TaxID=28565 RepID=UPI00374448EF
MEYFDFEGASRLVDQDDSAHVSDDDIASDCIEFDEADAAEKMEALTMDQGVDCAAPEQTERPAETAAAADHADSPESAQNLGYPAFKSDYPMFKVPEPCDFCRRMGLDCFLIERGELKNGCTCCISLYRECSFTHKNTNDKGLDTLHTVNEDTETATGGLTGKRALKSLNGSTLDDFEGRGRKSGARFSREAVRILKNWLSEHSHHPYPTEEEKDELKNRTGLKRSQIANWLANARRRGKVRPSPQSESPLSASAQSSNFPNPLPSASQPSAADLSLMTPLERWKHSPPENEPASARDILRAMATTSFPGLKEQRPSSGHVRSSSRRTGSSNDSSYSSMFHAPSISSMDTENRSSISDMSFASAFSHRSSLKSFNSADRKERRRRRKQPPFERQKPRGARIFQCTFCTDSFPAKYDWQRHEKSVHLPLERWICAPFGAVIKDAEGTDVCAFCLTPNPTEDHLEGHNYSVCRDKTMQERTFYRKDHLNQHLRLMHNVKYEPFMDRWQSTTNEFRSRCGFCNATFTTWKDRVDHVGAHFKNGADMAQWKGDWGFEPHIRRLVQDAVPPYLIAEERNTLNPYRATDDKRLSFGSSSAAGGHARTGSSSSGLPNPEDANCFMRLERELKAYIQSQLSMGIVPSDTRIQHQARLIIYGSDDPWNQTCADNPIWLGVLKRDCGLVTDEVEAGALQGNPMNLQDLGMQPPFAAPGGLTEPPRETNHWASSLRQMLDTPDSSDMISLRTPWDRFPSAGPSQPGSVPNSAGLSLPMTMPAISGYDTPPCWSQSAPQGMHPAGSGMAMEGFGADILHELNQPKPMEGVERSGLGLVPGQLHQEKTDGGQPPPLSGGTQPINIPARSEPFYPGGYNYGSAMF